MFNLNVTAPFLGSVMKVSEKVMKTISCERQGCLIPGLLCACVTEYMSLSDLSSTYSG